MRKMPLSCIIIVGTILFIACNKGNILGGKSDTPAGQRYESLMGITWGIKSANSIDSISTGTLRRYTGNQSDSLLFLWTLNPNVDIIGIFSTIGSITYQTGIKKISFCSLVSSTDTSTIAYDTVICSSSFRPHYSDTIFISKISDNFLVFRIRYSFLTGNGVEIDSLYRTHYR